MKLRGRKINIFPLQRQQLAHSQSSAQIQPDKYTIAVAVAGLDQRLLLVIGKGADFRLFSAWQGDSLAGVIDQQTLLYGLL